MWSVEDIHVTTFHHGVTYLVTTENSIIRRKSACEYDQMRLTILNSLQFPNQCPEKKSLGAE